MHPFLNTAFQAARKAGSVMSKAVDRLDRINVEEKQRFDYVTDIDRQSESIIIEAIQTRYPDHAILAEESGEHSGSEYTWIIDPLDGTSNFIHGFPHFAISIGIEKEGIIEHGLVYDPLRDELFHASRGRGAFLNDRRIRVSAIKALDNAFLGTGINRRDEQAMQHYLAMLTEFYQHASSIRRAGSASLDLSYVAAGRLDGFFELGLKPWDVAAGSLLVQEAGGAISNMQGGHDYLFTEEIVAAPIKLLKAMLQIIHPIRQA